MTEYVKQPVFWLSVILVAVVVNWLWAKFGKGGKLV